MVNKHEVRIYLPNILKHDAIAVKMGFLPFWDHVQFVRYEQHLDHYQKDEVTTGYDNSQRELTCEHTRAYLNLIENNNVGCQAWVTDADHRLAHQPQGVIKATAYEILFKTSLYQTLLDACNDFLSVFNTVQSPAEILQAHHWMYYPNDKTWTNLKSNHQAGDTNSALIMLKQEAIARFDNLITNLDL